MNIVGYGRLLEINYKAFIEIFYQFHLSHKPNLCFLLIYSQMVQKLLLSNGKLNCKNAHWPTVDKNN